MSVSYITALGIALPQYQFKQNMIASFMESRLKLSYDAKRKLKILYKLSAIEYRHSVLPDYDLTQEAKLYTNTQKNFPSTAQRMEVYQEEALPLAKKAALNCLKEGKVPKKNITHLITVSCTGMYAPGLDIELVESLGLSNQTHRTCVNFMGCYASMNALKVAQSICQADENAKVLIVGVELCTLHLQDSEKDDDLLANTLFADGAAAILIEGKRESKKVLLLDKFYCDLAPQGQNDMSWHIHNTGFLMRLSSYVPEVINQSINQLFEGLLENTNLKVDEIDNFALHPGGRKILEVIAKAYQIPQEKLQASFDVLSNYGNMSSVSIIFVLKLIWETLSLKPQEKNILALALGPGLTLESALMKFLPAEKSIFENNKAKEVLIKK